ncbi:hypothetical protein [Muricomes intestini]|jgi:protoheme ferro-lyase|uniref:hypothetical protein n=1 Tax=Muricomes intestini TaxID=1796634 RepID=UPI002FDD7323
MMTKKEIEEMVQEEIKRLSVGSPEFLQTHNEIMSDIEKAKEGLGESKRQTEAGPDL